MAHVTGMDAARGGLGVADILSVLQSRFLRLDASTEESNEVIRRILGVRQLAQAATQSLFGLRRVGVAVDVVHAASMATVAWRGPRHLRRMAIVQTALATGLAVGGIVEHRRCTRR